MDNMDNIDTIVSHSLGSATAMKLNEDYNKKITTRNYGTPTVSWFKNNDKEIGRASCRERV